MGNRFTGWCGTRKRMRRVMRNTSSLSKKLLAFRLLPLRCTCCYCPTGVTKCWLTRTHTRTDIWHVRTLPSHDIASLARPARPARLLSLARVQYNMALIDPCTQQAITRSPTPRLPRTPPEIKAAPASQYFSETPVNRSDTGVSRQVCSRSSSSSSVNSRMPSTELYYRMNTLHSEEQVSKCARDIGSFKMFSADSVDSETHVFNVASVSDTTDSNASSNVLCLSPASHVENATDYLSDSGSHMIYSDFVVGKSGNTNMHTYMHTNEHPNPVYADRLIGMHTCIHTYIPTCVHMRIHTYIHTYKHTYTRTHIHTYIHSRTYIHTYTNRYIHVYWQTYMPTYMHTFRRWYMHACTQKSIKNCMSMHNTTFQS